MREPGEPRRRWWAVVVPAVLVMCLAGGCGGSSAPLDEFADAPITSEASAPSIPRGGLNNEDVLADPAEVREGLGVLKGLVTEIAGKLGSDRDRAREAAAELRPVWESIEGRVKAEDAATHQSLEERFVEISAATERKDEAAAKAAAGGVVAAADAYLATHPAG